MQIDFVKLWREAYRACTDPMLDSLIATGSFDDLDGADEAAARVLEAAFAVAVAEERARVVAWLQKEAGKTHECYEHVLLDAASSIEQGAAMDELIARDADLI